MMVSNSTSSSASTPSFLSGESERSYSFLSSSLHNSTQGTMSSISGVGVPERPFASRSRNAVPFSGAIHYFQMWVDALSLFVDYHFSLPVEVFFILIPFFVGFWKVLWPPLMRYIERRVSDVRQRVCREVVSLSTTRFNFPGTMGQDRNAIVQQAIFLYLTKVIWLKHPLPANVWRNKAASFLLIDPFRSRVYESRSSPFYVSSSDSDDLDDADGDEGMNYLMDAAGSAFVRSKRLLQRLVLIKLPVEPFWIPIGVNGIQVSYHRKDVKIEKCDGVKRTLFLQAYGKGAEARIKEFVDRALEYYISSIPTSRSRQTRYFYELQLPTASGGVGGPLPPGGGAADSSFSLLFKRYVLADDVPLHTVFFPERERVQKLVDQFLFRQGRFATEGFPYKLGFLLYGPPGTGKTALVKALAAYTGRHVVSIPLHLIRTNQQLYDIFLGRSFTCVGEIGEEKLPLEEIIFYMDDTEGSNEVILARQRKRVVRMRKPARLTASISSRRRSHAKDDAALIESQKSSDPEEDRDEERSKVEEDNGVEESREEKEKKEEGADRRAAAVTEEDGEYTQVVVELPEIRQKSRGRLGLEKDEDGGEGGMYPGSRCGAGLLDDDRLMLPSTADGFSYSPVNEYSSGASQGSSASFSGDTRNPGTGFPSRVSFGTGDGKWGVVPPLSSAPKRSIFSMFDAATDKLDLSGLLNVLDGVVDTPGRIMVLSTQHPERLDPALVRPGRISVKIRMDYVQFDALVGMAGLHFGDLEPSLQDEWDVMKKWEEMQATLQTMSGGQNKNTNQEQQEAKSNAAKGKEVWEESSNDLGFSQNQYHPAGEQEAVNMALDEEERRKNQKSGEVGQSSSDVSTSLPKRNRPPRPPSTRGRGLTHIPLEMAKAHLPVRKLSEGQIQRLRETIGKLEDEEKEMQKNAKSLPQKTKKNVTGPTPSHSVEDKDTDYNFHISPSAIGMLCAEHDTFDEFIEGLVALIKGEQEY